MIGSIATDDHFPYLEQRGEGFSQELKIVPYGLDV
jgi:hypothetical protein